MVATHLLVSYLNQYLQPHLFRDYCPNGLQITGKPEVNKLVSGVTASQALIDAAIDLKADAILVHHGFFWKGEAPEIRGIKRNRIAALLANDINLIAYHLPLDAHPEVGNNSQLAKRLGINVTTRKNLDNNPGIFCVGEFEQPMDANELTMRISERLSREPTHLPGAKTKLETIAWCTGGAQKYLDIAVDCGVDAYLSGEISEQNFHTVNETGIHYYACGHHATERYGVQALAAHLVEQFDLEHHYIEIDNPI